MKIVNGKEYNYHVDCVRERDYAKIRKAAQDAIIKEAIAEKFK